LNLDIVPQAFAKRTQLPLPLPAPLQGNSKTGLLGYRLDAVELQPKAQNLGTVQGISTDEFEQQWKKLGAPALASAASRAYRFQRVAPQAGLELRIEPTDRQAQLQVLWNFDRHHAELNA